MRHLIIISFLIIPLFSNGQNKSITNFSDSINLYPLSEYSGDFYLRIWTERQVVDLWKRDSSDLFPGGYSVKLVTWTSDYFSETVNEIKRVHKLTDHFWSWQANKIINSLDSFNTINIITSINEKKCTSLLQSNALVFEYIDSTGYNCYDLYSLNESMNNSDSVKTFSFISYLSETLKLEIIWKEFITQIPIECYKNRGGENQCKNLGNKERRVVMRRRKKLPTKGITYYRTADNKILPHQY